jgi:hypothetical protein
MPEDTAPSTKAELLVRINERWAELHALIDTLTSAQMEQPLGDGWSAKVHLGHLAGWERSLQGLLRKEDRGAATGLPAEIWNGHDLEAINDFMARRAQAMLLAEARAESDAVHAETLALLRSLSEEDLQRPYSWFQPTDPDPATAPVIGWVHGNTWEHYDEHIGWLKAGLG